MADEKLTWPLRMYVVQRLAAFDKPKAIVRALREQFNVTTTPQSIAHYDPTLRRGRRMHPRLKILFDTTRAAVVSEQAKVSTTAARLGMLEIEMQRAVSQGNTVLAGRLQRLIDREIGGPAAGPLPPLDAAPIAPAEPSDHDDEPQ